ncbi:MAG: CARDB domain-containing protein, partial [bacterium]
GASSLSFKVGGETYPPSYSIPGLQPGASYTVQRKLVLGVAQNYLTTVKADANGTISESNEANNTRKVSFTVSP